MTPLSPAALPCSGGVAVQGSSRPAGTSGLSPWRGHSGSLEGPWAGAGLEGSGDLLGTPVLDPAPPPALLCPLLLPHPRSSAPTAEPTPGPLSTASAPGSGGGRHPLQLNTSGSAQKFLLTPVSLRTGRGNVSGLMRRPAATCPRALWPQIAHPRSWGRRTMGAARAQRGVPPLGVWADSTEQSLSRA